MSDSETSPRAKIGFIVGETVKLSGLPPVVKVTRGRSTPRLDAIRALKDDEGKIFRPEAGQKFTDFVNSMRQSVEKAKLPFSPSVDIYTDHVVVGRPTGSTYTDKRDSDGNRLTESEVAGANAAA